MSREVKERDIRMPEFKDAKLEDLEFRDDGAIVRKDRWERTVRNIACTLIGSRSKFECEDIERAVLDLVGPEWCKLPLHQDFDDDYYPASDAVVEVKTEDGSVLRNVTYKTVVAPSNGTKNPTWKWGSERDHVPGTVIAWREQKKQEQQA